MGSPDANGAAANGEAFVKLEVLVGAPGPPDDSDVIITSNGTDIRCKAGVTACGSANAADGADYTGELQGNATIRITDHFNGIAAGGGADPATVVDIPFPVNASCAATASTAIGGTCTSNTSANATVPGAVKDGKRSNCGGRPDPDHRRWPGRPRRNQPEHLVRRSGHLHPLTRA